MILLTTAGERAPIEEKLRQMKPLVLESMPLSLEEIFLDEWREPTMTSPKSSINPRLYTFRTALTSNFLMPLLNMAALAFCIPVMNLIRILSINNAAASPRQGETVVSLKETYRYLLMGDAEFAPLAILAVVGCSVLLGVMMFRFIASKKQSMYL